MTKHEAHALLTWAKKLNPGAWSDHCEVVARAAETIAVKCGIASDQAYVCGLLHDIGRYEGFYGLHHIYAGYELMKQKNELDIAGICLTHSFPCHDITLKEYIGVIDCNNAELHVITKYLANTEYNDIDKLIQLCDAISIPSGVCIIDVRLMEVARRHGLNDMSLTKWNAYYALKEYFDSLCGINIYELFYDEIVKNSIK